VPFSPSTDSPLARDKSEFFGATPTFELLGAFFFLALLRISDCAAQTRRLMVNSSSLGYTLFESFTSLATSPPVASVFRRTISATLTFSIISSSSRFLNL
jgi:hypothetical protein